MFRTLIYPSSGTCDYSVELPHWSYYSVKTEDLARLEYMRDLVWMCSKCCQNISAVVPLIDSKHVKSHVFTEQYDQCGNSTE